ncbi:MAG TPA: serine/threonine-protein kinase [Xanthomonadaceae bacterium]|jgi:tetratricopeptide (TPR) repeat protein|nr:serine/threonine-protein kinase [Xanthomonadaceae bacterium]
MHESTHVMSSQPSAARELPEGARLGTWRVLRVIGRGGMGEVYLAERADTSFDKQVALKLVQGVMTPTAHARFLAEKQALARLEHPHIARLIDAGETDVGWPYLVMEYVDGMPIDDFLAGRDVEDVLRVFLQVCDAAGYAHRQLVLHRDIKPNNILVDRQGDAKLLDFGIAKLLQSSDTAEESKTVERAYTPEYASPEQVFGRPIGVASDIYSLGVLLYRLLTGLPPYAIDPGDTAGLVRALNEDTVAAPSRAMLGDATLVAGPRRRRSRQLAGDLDTIVVTALRKQPERRYPSADAFADDIRRFLAHEPIRARPDSLRYRAGKFMRRNAIAVAATVAVTLALIGGLIASLWQAHIANEQRVLAEQRFEDVRSLAHAMLYDLNDELVKLPGSTSARRMLIAQALTYLQRLGEQNNASIPLRRELAEAWLRVGDVQGGPDMPNLGDVRGALASYMQADRRVASVLHDAPGDPEARYLQAQILLHRAKALYHTNSLSGTNAAYRQDIALWTALQRDGVHDAGRGLAQAQAGLATALFWNNKFEDALALYARSQATMQAAGPGGSPVTYELFLGSDEVNRGEALDWLGRYDEARVMVRHALDRYLALQRANPDDSTVRHAVAMAWMKLSEDMYDLTDKAPVLDASEHARAILQTEVATDPADMRARRLLALSEQESGDALVGLKRYDEAMARYQSALKGEQDMVARDPRDETVRQDLGNTWYGIAGLYQAEHRKDLDIPAFRQTVAVRQALVNDNPHAAALRRDLAQVLGDYASELPEGAEACRNWIASDALWQALAKQDGSSPSDQNDIATVHKNAAACR